MARVTITLEDTEKEALITLAMEERRDPREQAALMLSKELQRLGLLSSSSGQAGACPACGRPLVSGDDEGD